MGRPDCRRFFGLLLVCGLLALSTAVSAATEPASTSSDVIRTLARERAYGEDGATMLKSFAAKKPTKLAKGQLLYSEARAEFEGLIEALKADLRNDRDPREAPAFQASLRSAVAKREAFFGFLKAEVLPMAGNDKAGILAAIPAAAALIPALIDGAVKLWGEWRKSSSERREEIERQLDAQKWQSLARIAG